MDFAFCSVLLLSYWHHKSCWPCHVLRGHAVLWVALAIHGPHATADIAVSSLILIHSLAAAAASACHAVSRANSLMPIDVRLAILPLITVLMKHLWSELIATFPGWTTQRALVMGNRLLTKLLAWTSLAFISHHVSIWFIKFGVVALVLWLIDIDNVVVLLVDWLVHSILVVLWHSRIIFKKHTWFYQHAGRSFCVSSIVIRLKLLIIKWSVGDTTAHGTSIVVLVVPIVSSLVHRHEATRSFVLPWLGDARDLANASLCLFYLTSYSRIDVASMASDLSRSWLEILGTISRRNQKISGKIHMAWWADCIALSSQNITFLLLSKLALVQLSLGRGSVAL